MAVLGPKANANVTVLAILPAPHVHHASLVGPDPIANSAINALHPTHHVMKIKNSLIKMVHVFVHAVPVGLDRIAERVMFHITTVRAQTTQCGSRTVNVVANARLVGPDRHNVIPATNPTMVIHHVMIIKNWSMSVGLVNDNARRVGRGAIAIAVMLFTINAMGQIKPSPKEMGCVGVVANLDGRGTGVMIVIRLVQIKIKSLSM